MSIIENLVNGRETIDSAVPADYPVALLEFTKYRDVNQLNIYLRKELSNRYSYYYSRVEASIYAPLFAAILTVLTAIATSSRLSFNLLSLTGALLVLSTIIISYWLFHYQVQLLKEIDAIETLLVLKEKNRILKLIQLLRSNKLIPQLESKSSKGHDQ